MRNIYMKRTILIYAALLCVMAANAQDRTYFISPDGDDSASGLSVKEAWRTLEKINGTEFQPGDRILLESGGEWKGRLSLKGSGTAEKPVVLSSFGGKVRPVINMGDAEGAAVLLQNSGGWIISNLEITSGSAPEIGKTRLGIHVKVDKIGAKLSDITIKDCFIHDIWGQMGGVSTRSSAILVDCGLRRGTEGERPSLCNVLIERNRIERVDKTGIVTNGVRKGLRVRRNHMDNIGGDGIIVGGSYRALVEFNVIHRSCLRSGYLDLPGDRNWWPHTAACWLIRCEESIMQFNEVYNTGREPKNGDGFAYDFDFYCKRCIAQYNYSQENHGFILFMYDIFQNVARYNVSENDKTHLVQMQGSLKDDGNVLYNNVFYVDRGTLDIDFFRGDYPETAKDIDILGARFHNNIFYATGQGRFRTVYSLGETMSRKFDEVSRPNLPAGSIFKHNCYFGPWKNGLPDDPEALVADPQFVAPGTGGEGLCSLDGYRLMKTSPCINSGMYIPDNGGRDFWGNGLEDGHTDFGIFEAVGTGVFADKAAEAEADKAASDASVLAWARWSFPIEIKADNPEATEIMMYEPIEEGITGSVSWTDPENGKTISLSVEKAAGKKNFVIPLKTDKETLLKTKLQIRLKKGDFIENFEIPFSEEPKKRR